MYLIFLQVTGPKTQSIKPLYMLIYKLEAKKCSADKSFLDKHTVGQHCWNARKHLIWKLHNFMTNLSRAGVDEL